MRLPRRIAARNDGLWVGALAGTTKENIGVRGSTGGGSGYGVESEDGEKNLVRVKAGDFGY